MKSKFWTFVHAWSSKFVNFVSKICDRNLHFPLLFAKKLLFWSFCFFHKHCSNRFHEYALCTKQTKMLHESFWEEERNIPQFVLFYKLLTLSLFFFNTLNIQNNQTHDVDCFCRSILVEMTNNRTINILLEQKVLYINRKAIHSCDQEKKN